MTTEEPTWEELLGSNNWDGLLDPLNLSLRKFILRCGDHSQAVGEAFNINKGSKYFGSSRYGKEKFFEKVMLESSSPSDYQLQAFLYVPAKVVFPEAVIIKSEPGDSWDRESNMLGYIAVTTDEASQALGRREIYIVWHGTMTDEEGNADWDIPLVSAEEILVPPGREGGTTTETEVDVPKVMSGWMKLYVSNISGSPYTNLSAREQLWKKMEQLRNQYKDEKLSIIVTGHSLGASLATLSAFDLAVNGFRDIRIGVILFASPHVGDQVFVDKVNECSNLKVLHTRDKLDIVPLHPLILFGYRSVGVDMPLNRDKSPYLKTGGLTHHDLQGLLHTVAGWNGEEEPFELKVERSLALANKTNDLLTDDHLIPANWVAVKNKGMIRRHDDTGEWEEVQDVPEPEFPN